jgi:hypothetical protein
VLSCSKLTLVTALAVLASCTGADAPPDNESPAEEESDRQPSEGETAGGAAVPDDEVPAWYAERDPMPSCGSFEMDEIHLDNPDLEDANRCLLDAFETGEPAELQATLMTEEGDPIIEVYRVIGKGELEKMVDTREDEHGNMKFYYAECAELAEARPQTGPTVRPGDCDYDEQRTFPPTEG